MAQKQNNSIGVGQLMTFPHEPEIKTKSIERGQASDICDW
jgi:hypothetical protein